MNTYRGGGQHQHRQRHGAAAWRPDAACSRAERLNFTVLDLHGLARRAGLYRHAFS